MADVYQNWILYNVGKAIKNWAEYPFDWTMLNEYNQLVTYYDTAQQQIRTSIINKWVNVPANATIDEYPWYIDQIDQWDGWILVGKLKLYPYQIYTATYSGVEIWSVYSWFEWSTYYWLNSVSTYWNSHDEHCFWICTYKKGANSDISYWRNYSDFSWAGNTTIQYTYFYKKWNEIRCYIVVTNYDYPYEYGSYAWRRHTWDYINNTITIWWQWHSDSVNPTDWWEDLTWWTLVSWSSRVQSVGWNESGSNWYIYLTLK